MRKLRIATVSFLIDDAPHTVEGNLARAIDYIAEAKQLGANIVCLPETCTTNNVEHGHTFASDYEEWDRSFGEAAREHSIHVIAPFYAMIDDLTVNQATLYDDCGEMIGSYNKVQPTGWEAQFTTTGDELPVFDTDLGKIAIMICMDIYFPEIARIYAMKGAEILFWPTTTHGPTQSGLEAQLRSRAIDNSLTIVESNLAGSPPYAPYAGRFYPGNARVVDHNGDIIAQTGRRAGIAIAEIDLDEKRTTQDCFLINSPDDTRSDLEALVRTDLYAKEYAALAREHKRFYDTLDLSQKAS